MIFKVSSSLRARAHGIRNTVNMHMFQKSGVFEVKGNEICGESKGYAINSAATWRMNFQEFVFTFSN